MIGDTIVKPILTEDLKNNGVPLSGYCFSAELANDFAAKRQRRVAKMHAQIESVSWFYSSPTERKWIRRANGSSVSFTWPLRASDLRDKASSRAPKRRSIPGIESTPGVCGGEPCIARTRIPVWVLEQLRRAGASDSELLRAYPTLRNEHLTNAWRYVRAHWQEIEDQIRENKDA